MNNKQMVKEGLISLHNEGKICAKCPKCNVIVDTLVGEKCHSCDSDITMDELLFYKLEKSKLN